MPQIGHKFYSKKEPKEILYLWTYILEFSSVQGVQKRHPAIL